MNIAVQIYTMIEDLKMTFGDVAEKLGISAREAAKHWAEGEKLKIKFKSREKVVYRKRMTTSTLHHKKLVKNINAHATLSKTEA
ncbi:Hypothetical protein KNT65_gp248 [Escherichia phage EcS1]|uniref:Uncharacterized protein n=1 Tax=Escherichia phage EcS1 TaxID=2083276 RepID=A0A2Z5ZCN8_9CAUD|nr:Hypothetical protein KNT65_gp248 [Escherichia phage EcS1]BBC78245.1 Hypothetical protein [Escherichia phage EcS1]